MWVRGGRIEAVGPEADAGFRAEQRHDASGLYLVPGMIDAHVHLELDSALRSPKEQLARTPEEVVASMARRAQQMLFAGITTTRDCGGGAHHEHALRGEINDKRTLGPRLLCCGQPLTTPLGHCHFWGGGVSERAEIEVVLERQLQAEQIEDSLKIQQGVDEDAQMRFVDGRTISLARAPEGWRGCRGSAVAA